MITTRLVQESVDQQRILNEAREALKELILLLPEFHERVRAANALPNHLIELRSRIESLADRVYHPAEVGLVSWGAVGISELNLTSILDEVRKAMRRLPSKQSL